MNTYLVEWLQADWVETVKEVEGFPRLYRKKVNCGGWTKVRAKSEQAAVDAFRESNGIKPRAKIHAMICPA